MVACDLAKVSVRVRFSLPAPIALIALAVERTLGKGKVTCSNHVESTSSAFGEMDIIPGFEPGGGSSILSGPAI